MTQAAISFGVRSREIAQQFLQTVVVIDDQAWLHRTVEGQPETESAGNDGTGAVPTETHPLALLEPTTKQVEAADHAFPDSHDLDAKKVINGFAKNGLVCAVLNPTAEEVDDCASTLAIGRADIVIVDWVLHNDYGNKTLEIISALISQDPERLRLIAVYTGQTDLVQISNRVEASLKVEGAPAVVMRDAFTIVRGGARVAVFAKAGTNIPAGAEGFGRIVESENLPEKLVSEFAQMTSGLVTHVALASLAGLRRYSHRLLLRLAPALDAGYLWHRVMQYHPEEAEEHLALLVLEEFAAILRQEEVQTQANIGAIEAWLSERIPDSDFKARFDSSGDPDRAQAIDLLTDGCTRPDRTEIKKLFVLTGSPHKQPSRRFFAETAAESQRGHEDLAMLLSLQSHYGTPAPTLQLGSIIQATGTDNYWVCVQPACDCVRLKGQATFPLLPLQRVADTESFHLVVLSSDRTAKVRLQLKDKPSDLYLVRFTPESTGVVEAKQVTGGWEFKATDDSRYAWVATLKPQHGLSIAERLSTQLRRVGLVQSEWLRLWTRGKDD